jgi:hypothetical protein
MDARRVMAACAVMATGMLAGCRDSSSADPSVPVTTGFPLFGPGPHWIDEVTSGKVTFDAVAVVGVDLNTDGVADLTVDVSGPTTVLRFEAQRASPADERHRNHLDLEIVSMVLEADEIRFRAGDGVGNLASDGPLFSIGTSDEVAVTPQLAHDDFAIYFEGEISGRVLHNKDALRMVATIDRLPPIGNEFEITGPPVPLFGDDDLPSGFQIVSVTYTPQVPK